MGFLIALLLFFYSFAPQCAEEDGHTQQVCVWDDGAGDSVLNVGHGRYWLTLDGE
ncbi:hypothetical protein [Streptomyces agglomeratus]|uniref:hypothetical protein n=1 Tax=Streptomyces agglomeratus TaxID=285458 RepID=UPI001428CE48|nr:hypothetical protein [Streptomyces agglomeratus]